jgi:ketosteroid isomerase-like protein
MSVRATADALAGAMIARDHAALMAHYAEDVTFHSPVTPRPFAGRDQVGAILRAVMDGFEHWERTFVLTEGDTCVFGARARIAGALMRPLPAVLAAGDRALMRVVRRELGTPPM